MIRRLMQRALGLPGLGLEPPGLRALVDAAPNLLAVIRGERLSFANAATVELLRVTSLSELTGRSLFDFVHPVDRERARAALETLRRERKAIPLFDVRLVAADGSVLDVESWLASIRIRGRDAVLVHARDRSITRRTAEKLRESEARYRRLAENSSDVISEYDASGALVYVSPSIERVLGYTQDRWLRELEPHLESLTHPDDWPGVVAMMTGSELPATVELLHRVRHRDGEYRWLHTRGRRSTAEGEARLVLTSRDVTEEQRALEALRESEARFQSLARAAPVGIFRIDNKGRHVYLNERWSELTGIPVEQALANPGSRPLHPEDDGKILELSRRALQERRPLRLEQRIIRPDGQVRWVLLQAVAELDAAGALSGWLGTLTDLSEKKAADAALAESEERLRLALEGADMCTWEWDAAARRVSWSANAARVFGLADGEEMPTATADVERLIDPADRELAREVGRERSRRREPFELEFRLVARDGAPTRWVLMRGHSVPERQSRAIGVAADVSERHRHAEERAALEARLRESQHLESLGLLAGGVAHDFNNLLVGILGNAELALERGTPDSLLRECLEEIRRAGDRAAGLVRQILAFAGRERIERERIDLRFVVDDTLESLRGALPPRAKLDWNPPGSPVWLDGDATQLRQVLMNLVLNSCEALPPEGGRVRVAIARLDAPAREAAPSVALEVSDTGYGVDTAALSQIFAPFFTTKGAGRGLGLAVVHGIVRAHGGSVQVESAPGRGTRMRVLLPARDRPAAAPPDAEARGSAPLRGSGTVLVVDDERGVRAVARRALEGAGYSVLVAADRHEALAHIRERAGEIAAIVLDLSLGEESGEAVLRALREVAAGTPVLATSGYAAEHALRRLEAQGIAGFVQKPFTPASLARSVAAALGRAVS